MSVALTQDLTHERFVEVLELIDAQEDAAVALALAGYGSAVLEAPTTYPKDQVNATPDAAIKAFADHRTARSDGIARERDDTKAAASAATSGGKVTADDLRKLDEQLGDIGNKEVEKHKKDNEDLRKALVLAATDQPQSVINLILGARKAVSNFFVALLHEIVKFLKELLDNIVRWVKDAIDRVAKFFEDAIHRIFG
jgi:hypothetical protein